MIDCKQFELALAQCVDRDQLAPDAQAHFATCRACRDLVEDFSAIAERVRLLSLAEPIPDLWPEIRQRLQAEGIIHNGSCEPPASQPRLVQRAPATTSRRG